MTFPAYLPINFPRRIPGDFGDHVPVPPQSAPTAAMGWREWWNWMDETKSYSDDGVTPVVANDLLYRTNGNLGVVASSQFVQATSTNRPTFKTGGMGGKSYALFDGTDNFMASLAVNNFFANNAATILIVASVDTGWTTGDQLVWDASGYIGINAVTGPLLKLSNWDGNADMSTGQSFADNTPFIYACKHIGGNLYDTKNNVSWSAAVASGNTSVLTGLLRIGVQGTGYVPMSLYALAVANVEISDANLALCVNYFKGQLGI